MSEDVIATPVAGYEEVYGKPGAFFFDEGEPTHILFTCPCGCDNRMRLPLNTPGVHPSWMWDGNREQPTLTPSIRDVNTCKFHGFLTAGVWSFVGDSGA